MPDMLIRKYIRAVISENGSNVRRLDKLSKKITRDILMSVKAADLSQSEDFILGPYDWTSTIDSSRTDIDTLEDIEGFQVTVSLLASDIESPDVKAYTFSDEEKFDLDYPYSFHVNVFLPKKLENPHVRQIYRELLDATRHELEHLSQEYLPRVVSPEYSIIKYDKRAVQSEKAEKYFLSVDEVPAFVLGFLGKLRVKTRQHLSDDIKRFLAPRISTDWSTEPELISPSDAKIIHDAWMDWASRNVETRSYQGS